MKKLFITSFAFAALLSSCGEAENKIEAHDAKEVEHKEVKSTSMDYTTVKEGSVVKWMGSHIGGVGAHHGTVTISKGELTVTDGKIANGKFTIDMTSIHTFDYEKGSKDYTKLVGHLGSKDFFNVDNFTNATFELTDVSAIEGGDFNSKVTGNLSILGIDKSITFDANINITDNDVTINSQPFTIDRTEWGNEYNKEGAEGVPTDFIISNDITLTIEATVTK